MECDSSRAARRPEHTDRYRTADLFFQREFAVTSPREPDDRSERNPNVQDMLAEPFSSNNKHVGEFLKQGAHFGHFSPSQNENPDSYMMERNNQYLANIAKPPIFEEPDWSEVSRPGTIIPPPVSSIQNPITQHRSTGHVSDWLIHSATTSPNTCPSTLALHGGKDSNFLHPDSEDLPDLEMQNMDIGCSEYEALEPNQIHTKSTHHQLPPIEIAQYLRSRSDAIHEFLEDENALVPYDLDRFIPSNYVPMGLPPDRFHSACDDTTRSVLISHMFATGIQNVPRPGHTKRDYIAGTRLLSSLRSAEARNSSHLNQMLSPQQSTKNQSSSSQRRAEDFLRAGRIYLAYLDSTVATPVVGSALSNTEEIFTWARNMLPVEVKRWLKFTKENGNSSVKPHLTSNIMPFFGATTLPSQIKHGKLVSKQKKGRGWDTLHASRSDWQSSYDNHGMENVGPLIKDSSNVHQNIEITLPTLFSDTVMENSPVASNLVPAQHIKTVARIEARFEELQEPPISDELTRYPTPIQPRLKAREDSASHVSSRTSQRLLPPVFRTFKSSGNTFVTPITSPNLIDDKRTSRMPAVSSFQSNSVEISPLSDNSFVTAEDDEVSMIPLGQSSECVVHPSIINKNFGGIAEGTETTIAHSVAPLTNELFGLHLASENRSLLDQQNHNEYIMHHSLHHNSMSLFSRETLQSHDDNLANSIGSAEYREALPRGGDMLMVDIVDKSANVARRVSASNNASDMSRRIAQSHEPLETQSKQLTLMKRQTSMKAAEEHLDPSEAPGSNDNGSPAGKQGYFCQKCNKAYKRKVYLLKHEEKCVHGDHQRPHMPSPTDFTSLETEGPLSMPSLDCKLPSGNSYCSACNKEFTGVGRLRLHLERACPVLKQVGIYDRTKERLKERGDQDPTSLRGQSEASTATLGFTPHKAESGLTATSSSSCRKIKERKGSLIFTKTKSSLNVDNADGNLNPLNMGGEHRTSYPHSILRRASMNDHEDSSSEPVVADYMAVPISLQRNQASTADRTVAPVLVLPPRKPLGFTKASDNPATGDDGSSVACAESDDESDSEQLLTGEHSIQGDDKDRILGYPERTRLFSSKITRSSPSVHSPANLFEDIPNIPNPLTTRRASSRHDNRGSFGPIMVVMENKRADQISSLIVSVPSKTLCGVAHGKIEKDLARGDDTKEVVVWPSYEVPTGPASTFEFKITAPDGFNLLATIKQILPKLVFKHHVGKGWVAVLQTILPSRRTSTNNPANESSRASSNRALDVKVVDQAKLPSHGKDMFDMGSSGSRSLKNSSAKTGGDPGDLIQGKKRKSSRLSEFNNKDMKDASVGSTKRRKVGN